MEMPRPQRPELRRAWSPSIPAAKLLQEALLRPWSSRHLYERDEIFVPDMMISTRAMSAALGFLTPRLVDQGVRQSGRSLSVPGREICTTPGGAWSP